VSPETKQFLKLFACLAAVATLACKPLVYLACNGKTKYAPGYSEFSFCKIKVGMHSDQVIAILGCPLRTFSHRYMWRANFRSKAGKMACQFDPLGQVTVVSGNCAGRAGTRIQLERMFGRDPNAAFAWCKRMSYSLPALGGNRTHLKREVIVDESERVIAVNRETWFD